jgi:hypothetical protein
MKSTICDLCDQPMKETRSFEISKWVDTVGIIVIIKPTDINKDVCQPCLRLALREITDDPVFQRLTDTHVKEPY